MTDNLAETNNGNKRCLIKFVGGERKPTEIMIGPGTNTSDILKKLGLKPNDYMLSNGSMDSVYGADENIYPLISEGGLLYVGSRAEAGF